MTLPPSVRILTATALLASAVPAQQSSLDVAKASQNPISSMISVPFKNRWNFETGTSAGTQYSLIAEPVIPMDAGSAMMLIPRLLVPYVSEPVGPDSRNTGIGDVQLQLFVSPKAERRDGLIFGVGPMFTLATASDQSLGAERWNAGFAAAALVMPDRWVVGFLMTQQWSFAGDADRAPVAPFSLQPLVNYNLPAGWSLVTAPTITTQWLAGDDAPVFPIGGGFAKVFALLGQHLSAGAQAYANPIRTEFAPSWTLEATVKLLFPQ